MNVQVRLFGTLRQRFPAYQHSRGMQIELQDGATVQDLRALLEVPESEGVVIIAEGRILKADDRVPSGVPVNVMQAMGGG